MHMPDTYSPTRSIWPLKTQRKITVIGAAIAVLAIGFTWQLKLGIPAMAIVGFGDNVSSTQDEAEAIREWALVSKAKRIIVPTGIFAARRAQWIFDRELTPIGVQVMVHAVPSPDYTLADWWRHRSGLIDFNDEVLKYLYYRAKD